jgi:hypothetical protein
MNEGYRRHYQPRRPEKDMSLDHIALIIAAPILVLIITWAPLLDFIGPPWRFLQPRGKEEASDEGPVFGEDTERLGRIAAL